LTDKEHYVRLGSQLLNPFLCTSASLTEAGGLLLACVPVIVENASQTVVGSSWLTALVPGQRSVVLLHGVQSSRLSWWRIEQDLTDLDWQVHAVDLLGHGDRAALGPEQLSVEDLARDVLEVVPGPVDLLVGHSLGAIVALTAVQLAPHYTTALVIEDPPGLAGSVHLDEVADRIVNSIQQTRADPATALQSLPAENPVWSFVDVQNAVQNRLRLDLTRVTGLLRTEHWDLQSLVGHCPVPLQLLAATRDSTLLEPDRTAVMNLLPKDQITIVDSGHTIHRERPGLWLQAVLQFASPIL